MNTIQKILSGKLLLMALELDRSDYFNLLVAEELNGVKRTTRRVKLSLRQLLLLLSAFGERGEELRDVIDRDYESMKNEFDVKYRNKKIVIDMIRLFGKPLSILTEEHAAYVN